jgi:putative ABC transport system permease protein
LIQCWHWRAKCKAMLRTDYFRFTLGAIRARRARAILTALGIGVGVAAVVILTSIGATLERYVLSEFTQFGTNIIQIQPGKSQTFGASIGAINSLRPLTIEDALALERAPYATNVVPFVQGNAEVEANGRVRRTLVSGCGTDMARAFGFKTAIGSFLPPDDPTAPRAVTVLGAKMRKELYGDGNPLGTVVRVGGERYRVIGVMEAKGNMIGIDLDDTIYIPAARALSLFNRNGLFEIDVLYAAGVTADEVVGGVRRIMTARHGREDFTLTTQQEMLDTLGSILNVLTFAVGALGGISLLVGGVGIFTIMTIAVRERTSEIGLLCALGSRRRQILMLFLGEAVLLAALGGCGGLLLGLTVVGVVAVAAPTLPVATPVTYVLLAECIAIAIGLVSGVLPAMRASRLEPVDALRAE